MKKTLIFLLATTLTTGCVSIKPNNPSSINGLIAPGPTAEMTKYDGWDSNLRENKESPNYHKNKIELTESNQLFKYYQISMDRINLERFLEEHSQ
jgi:hypothetical protein